MNFIEEFLDNVVCGFVVIGAAIMFIAFSPILVPAAIVGWFVKEASNEQD